MSFEDIIKTKQRIDQQSLALKIYLAGWRNDLVLLSNSELELLAARVLDTLAAGTDRRDSMLKMHLLSSILRNRRSDFQISAFKRFWKLASPEHLSDKFVPD